MTKRRRMGTAHSRTDGLGPTAHCQPKRRTYSAFIAVVSKA